MVEKKKRNDAELWQAIEDAAADDLMDEIAAMSPEELDAQIRAAGGDPEKIAREGEELARTLLEVRAKHAWKIEARQKLDRAWSQAARALKTPPLPRHELLARIETARRDPRFAEPLAALFRKRGAEASTDEALRELLDAIEELKAIAGDE